MDFQAGTWVGRYQIVERLGAGGMGEVYSARDTRLGRTVAIKVPGAELQAGGDRREALLRDAQIASVLSHPNIAALFEIGDDDGRSPRDCLAFHEAKRHSPMDALTALAAGPGARRCLTSPMGPGHNPGVPVGAGACRS